MKQARVSILTFTLLLGCAANFAQAQLAASVQLPVGTTIPAMLETRVDARKNKVGDEVVARTVQHVKLDGQVVIPKGSKVIGHVTESEAGTKQQPSSSLGIAFDHVLLKDGRDFPLALTIQAIAPDPSNPQPRLPMTPATAGGTTGGMPAASGQGNHESMDDPNANMPGRVQSADNSAYVSGDGLTQSGALTPRCRGVLGIEGMTLNPDSGDSPQGVLIVSQRHNVHLDGRTQLMLRIIGTRTTGN